MKKLILATVACGIITYGLMGAYATKAFAADDTRYLLQVEFNEQAWVADSDLTLDDCFAEAFNRDQVAEWIGVEGGLKDDVAVVCAVQK